jgi:hypothetical protein
MNLMEGGEATSTYELPGLATDYLQKPLAMRDIMQEWRLTCHTRHLIPEPSKGAGILPKRQGTLNALVIKEDAQLG